MNTCAGHASEGAIRRRDLSEAILTRTPVSCSASTGAAVAARRVVGARCERGGGWTDGVVEEGGEGGGN